jgi:hypothetical protein
MLRAFEQGIRNISLAQHFIGLRNPVRLRLSRTIRNAAGFIKGKTCGL